MSVIDQLIKHILNPTQKQSTDNLKNVLISSIMELTYDERKELLAMWKGRHKE